jgi:dihydropteroate synthase
LQAETPDPRRILSPLALRLGPRALPARGPSRIPGGLSRLHPGSDRLWFALDAAGLQDAAPALASIEGAAVEPFVTRDGPSAQQVLLTVAHDQLSAAARRGDPSAELLLDVHAAFALPPPAPRLMGVVNVTPDSFSDGGRFLDPATAVEHGLSLLEQGAALLDVGGESTRPGAAEVPEEEELARVIPVVRALAEAGAPVSIDTRKARVAEAAVDAGASVVNDVSAGRHDPRLLEVVAEREVPLIAMHMRGDPATMQVAPRYDDPVREVCEELRERASACLKAGIQPSKIILDPGIGFGKSVHHNLALLSRLVELRSLGLPLCLGVSRKSFISHVTGAATSEDWRRGNSIDRPDERVGGTAAAVASCVLGGADWLRVHDVSMMSEAAAVAHAIARGLAPKPN